MDVYKGKICIMGDLEKQKLDWLQGHVDQVTKPHDMGMIGLKIYYKHIRLKHEKQDVSMQFSLWEISTVGYRRIFERMYYKGASAGIICIDPAAPATIESIDWWVADFNGHALPGAPLFVVDLGPGRPQSLHRSRYRNCRPGNYCRERNYLWLSPDFGGQ